MTLISSSSPAPLLEAKGLCIGIADAELPIVDGIDIRLAAGEIVGMVGESGSGKTLTGLSLLGLLPPPIVRIGGEIRIDGERLEEPREWLGRGASMVFQDPNGALNPLLSLGFLITEGLRARDRRLKRGAYRELGISLLRRVAMPDPELRWRAFPHELSGGQRQRAMLAIALASEPRLLIADEPTTALDVTVQAQILRLLAQLNQELGLTILLITHDLGVVAQICERVLVMDQGRLIEQGPIRKILDQPEHPKTSELLTGLDGGMMSP